MCTRIPLKYSWEWLEHWNLSFLKQYIQNLGRKGAISWRERCVRSRSISASNIAIFAPTVLHGIKKRSWRQLSFLQHYCSKKQGARQYTMPHTLGWRKHPNWSSLLAVCTWRSIWSNSQVPSPPIPDTGTYKLLLFGKVKVLRPESGGLRYSKFHRQVFLSSKKDPWHLRNQAKEVKIILSQNIFFIFCPNIFWSIRAQRPPRAGGEMLTNIG